MTAKQPHDRYQSADVLVDALTSALAASNLSLPRGYRGGISSFMPVLPANASDPLQAGVQQQQPQVQPSPASVGQQAGQGSVASGTVTCFRCGAHNPSSRLYCTTCGDDLSNRRASRDVFLVNGRPVLASLSMQSGPMAGRTYRFHQDVSTVGRTNGNDLVISGRSVSRRHARLWFDNGHWYIEDVGSSNGTLVNNVRIYQPVSLNDGDVINFGDEVVVFNVTYGP
jgi:hypothetical protein